MSDGFAPPSLLHEAIEERQKWPRSRKPPHLTLLEAKVLNAGNLKISRTGWKHLKVARKARKNTSRKNSKLVPPASVSSNVTQEAFTSTEISTSDTSLIQVSAEDRIDPSSPSSESSFRPYHDEPEERRSSLNPIDEYSEEPEVFEAEPATSTFSLYNPYRAQAYMPSESSTYSNIKKKEVPAKLDMNKKKIKVTSLFAIASPQNTSFPYNHVTRFSQASSTSGSHYDQNILQGFPSTSASHEGPGEMREVKREPTPSVIDGVILGAQVWKVKKCRLTFHI